MSAGLALELPGDWTSARLLIRILYTIGSDWELTEVGLVHQETGDACQLSMRGAEPALPDRYRRWEDPAFPSFLEEDFEGLGSHKALVTVTPGEGLVGAEAASVLLRCGAALVDAGARAVAVPGSELAHTGDRWQRFADLIDVDEHGLEASLTALARAFVRLVVPDEDGWSTRGLAALGHREVVVARSIDEAYAFEVQHALAHRLLSGLGLTGTEELTAGHGPRMRVRDAGEHWRLEPV